MTDRYTDDTALTLRSQTPEFKYIYMYFKNTYRNTGYKIEMI